jgi:hypothetical protein
MALDDFVGSEVGIAVAATAVLMSPKARGFVRRGAVYGLAALIKAGDAAGGVARGAAAGAQQMAAQGAEAARETTAEAKTTARAPRSRGGAANKSADE